MNADLRATLAFLAGNLIVEGHPQGIYDGNREKFLTVGGELPMPRIALHDPDKECSVPRSAKGANFCLQTQQSHHICLNIQGKLFEGFDHGSMSNFNGRVIGDVVSLFDGRLREYFSYKLSPFP